MATILKASEGRSIDYSKTSEERTALASWHARLILGSYRADQANDPEIYVTAIAHLLLQYPAEIGALLTDPKDGIAGNYKWLPTVSEVKEEADRIMKKRRADWYRAKELEEQFALRDLVDAVDEIELKHRRAVVERIRAELSAHDFQFNPKTRPAQKNWKRFSTEQLLAIYPPKIP